MVERHPLAGYTSCDAADALVALGDPEGGAVGDLIQRSGCPENSTTGPAYTVEFALKSDPRPAVTGHYIDSVPAGAVLVLAGPNGLKTALFGGLMASRAKYLNAAGAVVLGKIRDLAEQRVVNLPVYSTGVAPCASNQTAKVVAINEPISVGDKHVCAGDAVIADENGVVVVPAEKLPAVLEYIPKRVAADKLVGDDILEGVPAAQAQKDRRRGL